MKNLSAIRLAGLGLVSAGAMLATQTVSAKEFAGGEISGSAAVSNIYLFRGIDQSYLLTGSGDGPGAISGDITYSNSGAYMGVWATSGLSGTNETDVYLGYGIELDSGLSVDLNVTSYVYSGNDKPAGMVDTDYIASYGGSYDQIGDYSEVILTLGYATEDYGVSFQYADNVAGWNGYTYLAISAESGDFSATLGLNDPDEPVGQTFDNDTGHLDITYAYSDNLSFTVSKIISADDEILVDVDAETSSTSYIDDDALFVVTYSLPIE